MNNIPQPLANAVDDRGGALSGTSHAIKHTKHVDRYWVEFTYRFNRRFDLPATVPRLFSDGVSRHLNRFLYCDSLWLG